MKVITVPVLSDNYAYLIVDENSKVAAAVDPAEPEKVLSAAHDAGVNIVSILCTHHHWDHAGGNAAMIKALPNLQVYGGDQRIPEVTHMVTEGQTFTIGALPVRVHFTPCHTTGHVLYEVSPADGSRPHALFTGDTLFVAGCGRFFEGTAQQMVHALIDVVAALPKDTLVYCGHEYTEKNLQFASLVEPHNTAVAKKLAWATLQKSAGHPTVPSTVGEELTYNPFLRVHETAVKESTRASDPVEVMAELRKRKDNF